MNTSLDYETAEALFVSTGHLPTSEQVMALVDDAHARFKSNTEGKNSQVYPALARVPSNLLGTCVADTNGKVYSTGFHLFCCLWTNAVVSSASIGCV
jgi:glutaminase